MSDLKITSLSAIEHILKHAPSRVLSLSLPKESPNRRIKGIWDLARQHLIRIHPIASSLEPAAQLQSFQYTPIEELLKSGHRSLLVALDHLQDSQNFGAICRTAEGLGIDGILIPKDRSVAVNAGVYHSSAGSVENIPISRVTNFHASLKKLKESGYWIVGAQPSDKATIVQEMPKFEKVVLILGAESEGLSKPTLDYCDWTVKIPLSGRVESLNASTAAAILINSLKSRA